MEPIARTDFSSLGIGRFKVDAFNLPARSQEPHHPLRKPEANPEKS